MEAVALTQKEALSPTSDSRALGPALSSPLPVSDSLQLLIRLTRKINYNWSPLRSFQELTSQEERRESIPGQTLSGPSLPLLNLLLLAYSKA